MWVAEPSSPVDDGSPVILLMSWDLRAGTLTAFRSDGRSATFPGVRPSADAETRIDKIDWSDALGGVIVYVQTGDEIVLELPRFPHGDELKGRLVLYLDQNHWSTLAKASYDPGRVAETELRAAERIREFVRERRIVIPLSGGHHVETTQYGSDRDRLRLAVTMLQLGRGWQMRAPLRVRSDEIYEAFRTQFATPGPTQGSTGVQPRSVRHQHWRASDAWTRRPSAQLELLRQSLESVSVTIDVMLAPDKIDRGNIDFWTNAQQAFSDYLDSRSDLAKSQRRRLAGIHLLRDLQQELVTAASDAGLTQDQFEEWVTRFNGGDPLGMPSFDVYRIVQRQRHMTRDIRWTRNDLMDMTHLSCAAAHADFVVAERDQTGMLNQALQATGRSPIAFRKLSHAVTAIENL
jgi:hypothetical protein